MRARQRKFATIICACCGESHVVVYTTRLPMYVNPAHRKRAYRARQRARRATLLT
jgi:hypothetical protein